jgi:dolichol-phosphate mannosyltransferase
MIGPLRSPRLCRKIYFARHFDRRIKMLRVPRQVGVSLVALRRASFRREDRMAWKPASYDVLPHPSDAVDRSAPTAVALKHWEVPAHETLEFGPRRTKYCFLPIVYNEGGRFVRQLERMRANAGLADIIVSERRSTDGCTEPGLLERCGVRALLTTDEPGGAAAIRMGFAYALRQGYAGVVLIDGNGKDGVEALPRYLEKLDEGWDFVQGSRFMPGGVEKNTPLARRIGIRFIMVPLVWLGTGYRYTDATNGFRAYSGRLLRDPRIEPLRGCFVHYNLQYYLSVMAPALKFRVVEIPVERVYPDDGAVPTKVSGFRGNFKAFWEMVLTVFRRYSPPA